MILSILCVRVSVLIAGKGNYNYKRGETGKNPVVFHCNWSYHYELIILHREIAIHGLTDIDIDI